MILKTISTKPRLNRVQRESKEQEWLVKWFELKYKDELIVASANGGSRNAREGANLKRTGVRAGVPDLQIFAARRGYNGLLIEMKAPKSLTSTKIKYRGRITVKQEEVIRKLNEKNYLAVVAWGWLEGKQFIDWYFSDETEEGF